MTRFPELDNTGVICCVTCLDGRHSDYQGRTGSYTSLSLSDINTGGATEHATNPFDVSAALRPALELLQRPVSEFRSASGSDFRAGHVRAVRAAKTRLRGLPIVRGRAKGESAPLGRSVASRSAGAGSALAGARWGDFLPDMHAVEPVSGPECVIECWQSQAGGGAAEG